uniref:CDP-diacylglycerol--serine O-phosphatidyltransferase n=1 Tax=Tetradesmus obliquus TaxID=3088 RepID=A0A383VUJ3_TETOB|eukprot:jgi/Sobl393_1/2454/SZX68076.1
MVTAAERQQQHGGKVVIRLNHNHRREAFEKLDPCTAFLYAPYTVSALLAGLALLAYYGDVLGWKASASAAGSSEHNAAAGLWAAVLVFLGYSVVQGPRTSMVRPHPALWRLVHGAAVLYVLLLVWLLFQTAQDARQFMKHLDPSLGVEVTYRDYGSACALWHPGSGSWDWSNVVSALDVFVLAHSLGWWGKALLIRNTPLLWAYSIGFELLEATFAHMLPNFNECWWDSWLLDVALCNSLGIYAGMATVHWLDCKYKNYNWQGLSELHGLVPRASRGLAQLLPYSWSKLDWSIASSPKRCLQSLLVVACFLTVEVNSFFLKFALWIHPPQHTLVWGRLLLWTLVGAPAVREYYEFIQGEGGTAGYALAGASGAAGGGVVFHKLGTFAWVAAAMLALETMLAIKFGRGLYPKPWPHAVLASWAVAVVVAVTLLAVWQLRLWRRHRGKAASATAQQQHQQQQHRQNDHVKQQ